MPKTRVKKKNKALLAMVFKRTHHSAMLLILIVVLAYFIKKVNATKGMLFIPGGTFLMGCGEQSMIDAQPFHEVTVDSFWIDATEVTNEQFERFVRATHYITEAERSAPVPGSLVFVPTAHPVSFNNCCAWWKYVPGASWRHPEGPSSSIKGREKHPVVHVTWNDAAAYASWAGKRLPTEAEFEYAARGGLNKKRYSCGNGPVATNGKWLFNIWQGIFPCTNTLEDGFYATAPVGSFPANGFGLYDMTGNVWEWCQDWYHARYYKMHSEKRNPKGPEQSFDPEEPNCPKKVQRGGSFLCNEVYCIRYLVGARGKADPNTSTVHCGFRCAKSFS